MTANNYEVNYEDERFAQVEAEKKAATTEVEQTYAGMINSSDQYYNAQIQASNDWADKQAQLQQEQTDFTIEQIEQQKDKANKDYLKEQSGAYVDWQKQSNKYGANAEAMAAGGFNGTGYSESSQVSMYNTYQNRVVAARESYNAAVLNYNNAIKDARLQNNAALAEIAYTALQQQLELSLQGFQYKNQLILDQTNKKIELDNMYYQRSQDILAQINHENAMAEEIRQYNETQKWQTEQAAINREFEAAQAALNRQFEAGQAELDRKHDIAMQEAKTKAEKELLDKQHQQALEKLKKQHEHDMAMLEAENAAKGTYFTGGGGSGGSGGGDATIGNQNYAVNTDYYRGDLNPDAKTFGTFSNGYQPKGISGHGTLKESGDYVTFTTKTLSGETKTVRQKIWTAQDGTQWYWEGRQNKYLPFKMSSGGSKYGGSGGGSGIKPIMKALD